jgi:hypothetical protein
LKQFRGESAFQYDVRAAAFGRASGNKVTATRAYLPAPLWQIAYRIKFGVTQFSHRGLVIYPFKL